jgi:DNA uptake protein ComE-like DNA-binding protein
MAAAAYFPSVVSMVTADVSDWQRVPGVGKVIAGAIVEAIRRKRNGTKL